VQSVRDIEAAQQLRFSFRRVWSSVDNYYTRTLTNRYRAEVDKPIELKDFELAKRILASFDLVLITVSCRMIFEVLCVVCWMHAYKSALPTCLQEWMAWQNQTDYMADVLGEPRGTMWQRNKLKSTRNDDELDPKVGS
jgi:hypothetical protein